jgi:hypothetical protein
MSSIQKKVKKPKVKVLKAIRIPHGVLYSTLHAEYEVDGIKLTGTWLWADAPDMLKRLAKAA